MSKLCLSTYLNVLKIYENPQFSGLNKILNALVNSICITPETIPDYEVSKIKAGKKNIAGHVMDQILANIAAPSYLDNSKRELYPLLNPSKLTDIAKVLAVIIQDDPDIKEDCRIDYVGNTKKNELININSNEFDLIAGIFLYVLKCTDNVHTEEFASEINEEFCNRAIEKYDTTYQSLSKENISLGTLWHSDISSQAKKFCRTYESSIELLPLCQIANIINPDRSHANEMYSTYCDCSEGLRNQIMSDHNIPIIQVDDKYDLYNLLGNFVNDIEKYKLASENKTYAFTQYVPRSLDYKEKTPNSINPPIFPVMPSRILPNRTASFLSQSINDYLYYKDKGGKLPVPFDWMWENLDLATCFEEELIFWLNLFIVSSCYDIQAQNKTEPKDFIDIPNIEYAKTIEDLHFLALLLLYDTYLNK